MNDVDQDQINMAIIASVLIPFLAIVSGTTVILFALISRQMEQASLSKTRLGGKDQIQTRGV